MFHIKGQKRLLSGINGSLKPKQRQQLADVVYFHHEFMLNVLVYFPLPGDVEGDEYQLCTDGQCRCDVALQRVAHHEQLLWLDA